MCNVAVMDEIRKRGCHIVIIGHSDLTLGGASTLDIGAVRTTRTIPTTMTSTMMDDGQIKISQPPSQYTVSEPKTAVDNKNI